MWWQIIESLVKGLYLSLMVYLAFVPPSHTKTASTLLVVALSLTVALAIAARRAIAAGAYPRGRPLAYLLYLLLESPKPLYIAVSCCLAGILIFTADMNTDPVPPMFIGVLSCLIGALIYLTGSICSRATRLAAAIAFAVILITMTLPAHFYIMHEQTETHRHLAWFFLAGVPLYYLLSFVGESAESEMDVAAWCMLIALGLLHLHAPTLSFVIPIAIFYAYVVHVLPQLRSFKLTLRGVGYQQVGLHAKALQAFGQALAIYPDYPLAKHALWDLHRQLDPIAIDADLLRLIDANVCLDRATRLLNEPPSKAELDEATRLLDLAGRREPRLQPRLLYWRAVSATHANDLDTAGKHLSALLDASDDSDRKAMLLSAWQLGLLTHPGLEARVGRPALQQSGRRLEAIAAAERALVDVPDEPTAWSLKRVLYAPLTLAEYQAGPVKEFDYSYCEQLGLAQINEPGQLQRGADFLAIAAAGLPLQSPRLWHQVAMAWFHQCDTASAIRACNLGKQAGLSVGHKQLPEGSCTAYFAMLKLLADEAEHSGDLDAAAANLSLFAEYDGSGLETLRTLAYLHERRGDPLSALNAVERGRIFAPSDADLLARRDKYTYSIEPEALRQAAEPLRKSVDVDYCLTTAKTLLDRRDVDADLLHWANHLTELALVLQPHQFASRLLAARVRLRLGQRDSALQILEDVREQRPEKFASSTEEEAWRMANRLLGELYLDELDRPDLAVGCLQEFRKSSKSGADTLYKLGVAYERLNERRKAASFYEQAASYEQHPRAAEAREGLRRMR